MEDIMPKKRRKTVSFDAMVKFFPRYRTEQVSEIKKFAIFYFA